MTAKLTGETVTDEQIRELRNTASPITGNVGWACSIALGEQLFGDIGRVQAIREARQICADAINARLPTTKGSDQP